ncbi:hypothetical protein, partial [Nocardia thraciensis]
VVPCSWQKRLRSGPFLLAADIYNEPILPGENGHATAELLVPDLQWAIGGNSVVTVGLPG